MCGRFTLRRADRIKIERVDTHELFQSPPRYNIAPTQKVWVVTQTNEERSLALFQWGLIPAWSDKPAGFINARAESIESKPSFKAAFRSRRCLIPADGFYEWEKLGKAVQPHYFQMKDAIPFSFAGIWDEWKQNGITLTSCAIVTTTANELLSEIHHRMPVILTSATQDEWLQGNARLDNLHDLLVPFPSSEMEGFTVSQRVNNTKADDVSLVEPVAAGEGLSQLMLF